jgi:hypothetical protein
MTELLLEDKISYPAGANINFGESYDKCKFSRSTGSLMIAGIERSI